MAGTVRIATAQYPIERFETLAAYAEKITRWVGEAADAGAELLVFPEYGTMEYAAACGAVTGDLARSLEAVAEASFVLAATHADLARRHGVHILAASGPARRPDGGFTNAARLFAPTGKSGVQDKLIMTPIEKTWGISAGSAVRVFETSLGRIGIAICYDCEFPLLVRAQVEAGAGLILIPSCTEFVTGYERVRTAARARALENGCVTVQSPTIGEARWSPTIDANTGRAGIFVPAERGLSDTGILAEGRLDAPGWTYATADAARLQDVRRSGEMRNHEDWALQPGAAPLAGRVEVVDLR
jgi:predicted amidohydrolase